MFSFFKRPIKTTVELKVKTKSNGDVYVEQYITLTDGFTSLETVDTSGDVELKTFKPKK